MAMNMLISRAGAPVFNAAVAAFAAAAVAFVIFAMPGELFASLVGATGLPAFLSAAEPPLGTTARLLAMAAGAASAFLGVRFLLGWLDEIESDNACDFDEQLEDQDEDVEWDMPRVRRADAHPDAPARRPLLAGQELGEPDLPWADEDEEDAEPDAPEQVSSDDAPDEEIPAFLAGPQVADGPQVEPESELEPEPAEIQQLEEEAAVPAEEADAFAAAGPDWQAVEEAISGLTESIGQPAGEVPEPDAQATAEAPQVPWPQTAEPARDPVPDDAEPSRPAQVAAGAQACDNDALMARLPLPEDRGESISTLFQRLDVGLASCEWPIRQGPPGKPRATVGDELRSALDDLQQLASRRT